MQQSAGEAEDVSLGIDGDGHLPMLIALLRRREEMLAPILLPRHRAAELHRGGRNDRFLGVERRLGAEAAADMGRDDADRFEVAFEQIGKRGAAKVRGLRRRPHRQHVGAGVVAREHGAAFERHGAAAMEAKLLLEHVCRARECRVDLAVAHGNDGGNVGREVAVGRRSTGARGIAAVADRRQDFEIDVDRGGGVLREIAVVRDRHGDGLADVADFAACQCELRARRLDRWIGHQHRNLAARHARRQIIRGQHRMDARHRPRRRRVDRADCGVGVRAAHEASVQRASEPDVVDEAPASDQQGRIFEARDAGAEMLRAHGRMPGTAQRGGRRYTESIALQSRQIVR